MATLGRQTLPNLALSGEEIKSLMRTDFNKLLDNHGLLSSGAFGRVAYEIVIRLHVDNPYLTPDILNSSMISQPVGTNVVKQDPPLAALERAPLANPSPEAQVESHTLTRDINSPNVERIRTGLPVPAVVPQQDGTTIMESVKYPAKPNIEGARSRIEDTTVEARNSWNVATPHPDNKLSEEESMKLARQPAAERDFWGNPKNE